MGCAVRLTKEKSITSRLVVSPWFLVTLFLNGFVELFLSKFGRDVLRSWQ
jgi:hypothetical protein